MDSLTQVVLGSAVGEAVLGRKVGNRAMVWGGLAGTLPDLDVLSGLVTDPMSALAYHRAFTHSLPFALLAAPILGLVVHRIYGGRFGPKLPGPVFFLLAAVLLWLLLLGGSYLMPVAVFNVPTIAAVITGVFALLTALVAGLHKWRGTLSSGPNAAYSGWTMLFFLCIVTHPLLDCFTAYGTQFLEPLSRVRIAWNTISVVDPFYTLPFLLLLVLATRKGRGGQGRKRLNRAGLIVSTIYLLLTVANAVNVGRVVDDSLLQRGIRPQRSVHSPTLGNNLLWSATIQAADTFYLGQYSLLDRQRRLDPLLAVAGNQEKVLPYTQDRELGILTWFTDGYYTILPGGEGRVVLCDLRYGLLGRDPNDPDSYTFHWTIDTTRRPVQVMDEPTARPDMSTALEDLWVRMQGKE
ncbi:metal-dependent hydrolase [Lewinella sp. IMCC34191]|uniref:metal-dependent hydrolase n=1 Tax=Lewinella sp. IMCC34191 TaxID=2259172 RepID=UPI000E2458D8|nr:metal-dependent hydrolase [Lewinella sp. IMCC34191]